MMLRFNQNDKVMVLGARGNLGGQIMRYFGNEYRLICWDKEDIDLLKPSDVWEKIVPMKPHFIINTVGYNAVDKCEESGEEAEKADILNARVVGELADAALALDATLVHYVSDYVFSGDNKDGYSEDAKTAPLSVYGRSKEAGEKEILKRAGDGLKYYLIRTSKLFGPKGESERSKESFFDLILRLSREQDELKAIDHEEISCFTYTPDLAKATLQLIEGKYQYGIYHLVNEGSASWYDGAKQVLKYAKIKKKLVPITGQDLPRPAPRPKYSVLVNNKFPKLRSWKKALKEYIKNYY